MKHFGKLLLCGLALTAADAQAQVTAGQEYYLNLEGTALYLSAETAKAGDGSELSLQGLLADGFDQGVVFTEATGGYNITIGNGLTVIRDEWYMHYKNTADVDLTNNNAIFAVAASGNGITLNCQGNEANKFVGCDSRNNGSKVYSDKTGGSICVFLLQTKAEALKSALKSYIAEAEQLLADTQEGTEPGMYPAEARTALSGKISDARTALDATDETVISSAIEALTAAISTYKESEILSTMTQGIYKFHHVANEGSLMATGWHANSWESSNTQYTALLLTANDTGYNFEFSLMPAPDAKTGIYNIIVKDNEKLVNANGALLVNADTSLTDVNAQFTVHPTADNQLRIRSVATGMNIGPNDNTKGWTWIHFGTKHTGNENGDLFTAELVKDLSSGIALTEAGDTPAVYYNLNGVRMDGSNLTPGVYVVRRGAKTTKVLVK